MGGGDRWNGKGLGDVLLEPSGELPSGLFVAGYDRPKPPLTLGRLICVKDAADVTRDLRPHGDLRSKGHRVPHEVELATPPGHSGEGGLSGSLELAMIVADHELGTPHPTVADDPLTW